MKRLITATLAAALIATLFVGCGPKQKPSIPQQSTSQPPVQASQSAPESKSEAPAGKPEVKTPVLQEATGTYNGRVDTNFIEITLDNTGAAAEFNIMEVQDNLNGLSKNDRVKITYIVGEDKQNVLKSIDKM